VPIHVKNWGLGSNFSHFLPFLSFGGKESTVFKRRLFILETLFIGRGQSNKVGIYYSHPPRIYAPNSGYIYTIKVTFLCIS